MTRWVLTVAVCVLALGCGPGPSLDVAEESAFPDNWEERRRRMDIRVRNASGELEHYTPQSFTNDLVRPECISLVQAEMPDCGQAAFGDWDPTDPANLSVDTTCFQAACWSQIRLCVGHRLMEIVDAAAPVDIDGDTVPPQSQATRAGLAEVALDVARETVILASEAIGTATGVQDKPSTGCTDPSQLVVYDESAGKIKAGEALGTTFAEAYWLADDAMQGAAQGNLAVADAAFDEYSSRRRAIGVAYHAPVLSRGHTAHLLLGNHIDPNHEDAEVALPIIDREPLRTTASSRHTNQALAHLREAGLHPKDILDASVSVDELIAGGSALEGHYLLKHLAEVYGTDVPAVDAPSYYEMTGLGPEDFAAARQIMAEELRAFDRSMTARLPALPLSPDPLTGESRTTEFPRYASTSSPPGPMPTALLMRRILDAPQFENNTAAFDDPVDGDYARRSYAHFVDYARTAAVELLRYEDTTGTRTAPPEATHGLASVSMTLTKAVENHGSTQVCDGRVWLAPDPSAQKVKVILLGYKASDVVLVTTDDGVRCLEGLTEGAECDPAEYLVAPNDEINLSGHGLGYDVAAQWDLSGAHGKAALTTRAVFTYRVRTDSGSGRTTYQHLATAPTGMEGGKTATVPVNCTLNDEATTGIDPVNDGGVPPASCTGLPEDQRIPLENELSEDGSAYEDSWRGYLDRALRAATEADALGEQLIEQGLTMDIGAENALAELEQLCGSSIDIDGFPGLSIADPGPAPYGGECLPDGSCPTDGYVCHQGSCVLDPLQALLDEIEADPTTYGPAGDRLAACLGPQTDDRLVSLGSHELCVWVDTTNPNLICQCPEGDECGECPTFLAGAVNCAAAFVAQSGDRPPGTEAVTVDGLGLFESEGGGTAGRAFPTQEELKNAAAAFRMYRNGQADALDDPVVTRTLEILHPSTSVYIAEGIRFSATPFNTGYLYRGDDTWFGTGTHQGLSPNWPCAGTPPVACGTGESGLFCDAPIICSNESSRRDLTIRLAEAALAARVITGARLDGLRFPIIPDGDEILFSDFGSPRSISADSSLSGGNELFSLSSVEFRCIEGLARERSFSDGRFEREVWDTTGSADPNSWGALSEWPLTVIDYGGVNTLLPPSDAAPEAVEWLSAIWHDHTVPSPPDGGAYPNRWPYSKYWNEDGRGGTCRPERRNRNAIFIAKQGLSQENVYDAIELLLEFEIDRSPIAISAADDPRCSPDRPPAVSTVDDLPRLEEYLSCVGDRVQQRGERTIFADLPQAVIEVLRNEGGVGVYPELGGEFATAVTRLRRGLIELQSISPLVSREISSFGQDVRQLDLLMRTLDIRDELAGYRLGSAISDRITQCAVATASISENGAFGVSGGITAAAVTCANSVVQIVLAVKSRAAESTLLDIEGDMAFSQFVQTLNQRITNIEALQRRVRDAQEDVDAGLAQLESIRSRGERAIARALFADSDQAGRMFRTNTVMRRRYNTTLARYKRARKYALQMAFLARIALEQRLGTSLAELGDLSLVEHPGKWVHSLCESSVVDASGLDYTRIRDLTDGEYESFEGEYVGEYVRKLEAVVESYRIDYPLHDGADTAVVSLRDDVFRTRAPCEYDSINLFASGGLESIGDPTAVEADGAWQPAMCADIGGTVVDCAGSERVVGDDPMLGPTTNVDSNVPSELGPPTGFEIVFGDGTDIGANVNVATTSFTPDTRLEQTVIAEPGRRYRLSWYGGESSSTLTTDQVVGVYEPDGSGGELSMPGAVASTGEGDPGWARYYRFFDTLGRSDAVTVTIAILPDTTTPLLNQAHELAGFMLEDVTGRVEGNEGTDFVVADHPPALFHSSVVSGFGCEDTDGFFFRSTAWTRVCENRCPASIASCADDVAEPQCYREASFTVTPHLLESGELFSQSSFARGNYNYRTVSMGLNFVGTELRDCSGADWPSTCYSSGSIPFSIDHLSPFPVTNHTGTSEYEAPLFNGRIVHGRGLAAERYVTNPISSADRALVEPYLHREFRGRPLNGTYRVRLWEEPGIRFDRLEDVQLVLNYRYWTRLD